MKLADVLILSFAVIFLIIGIDQLMVSGIGNAYWAIMLAVALYFAFVLKKRKNQS